MEEEHGILNENEKQANVIVAKVMRITFYIFTLVYLLNVVGIFVINDVIMTGAYIGSGCLLMLPTVIVKGLKVDSGYVKYINIASAALFVTLISIALTYHVVVIYVYPIAIASLYFSKLVNTVATSITVVGVSIAQIIAFYIDTPQDDNFTELYDVIIYGIIPRALALTAMAVIFTMLCSRTVALLSKLMEVVEEKSRYHKEMVMGFATLVENKDGSTGGHIKRTTAYVKLLSKELIARGYYKDVLTKEYVENLCMAAPMHDIGKISVPDVILQKTGKLTAEEFAIIKLHAESGGKIIKETFGHLENEQYTHMAYEVARYHHEKWNGKGYPEGLIKNEIPLCARIMAIADVFDAVSEKRCYRDAMPLEKCFNIIKEGSGQDFDPLLVEVFLDIREKVEQVHKDINR
ncbi:MAG: HD domain-containing protein [Lachnospiraceae bacterium]|nr:HD domain-containing protein [Lachnospiraceae bacterium]